MDEQTYSECMALIAMAMIHAKDDPDILDLLEMLRLQISETPK